MKSTFLERRSGVSFIADMTTSNRLEINALRMASKFVSLTNVTLTPSFCPIAWARSQSSPWTSWVPVLNDSIGGYSISEPTLISPACWMSDGSWLCRPPAVVAVGPPLEPEFDLPPHAARRSASAATALTSANRRHRQDPTILTPPSEAFLPQKSNYCLFRPLSRTPDAVRHSTVGPIS